MFRRILLMVFAVFLLVQVRPAAAEGENGTPEEAVAMVDKAIAFYKEVGRDKAIEEFSNPKGRFSDRDLYMILSDKQGVFIAHGVNRGLVGKNLLDLKDVNGVFIIREMVKSANEHPEGGWVSYTWTNPTTKKLDPKKTFVKVHDNLLFMVGVYDKSRG